MGALANSEGPDEMQHYASFHQGLHRLFAMIKQPLGTEIPYYREPSGSVVES